MQDTDSTHRAASGPCGRVFRKQQGVYGVEVDGRPIPCEISNSLRKELLYRTTAACKHPATDPRGCSHCRPNRAHRSVVGVADIHEVDPVAIGDIVRLVLDDSGGRGLITEVLPRRNTLVRRAAGTRRLQQIIAANVDQVLAVVATARPQPSWNLLDRYLAAAEESGIPAVVLMTKTDLGVSAEAAGELENYRHIGYPVIFTSAETGEGIDALRDTMRGRVSILAGKSGVGKTSLLNFLQPGLGQRVGEVSSGGPAAGKGRHTTSHVEMFSLSFGGSIVDTPGMREFGLWETATTRQRQEHEEGDLALLFPDLRPYVGHCKFGLDCGHTHEPHCSIREAVSRNLVSDRRYHSYLRLAGRE